MNARNAIRLRALSCGCALIVAVLAASGVASLFREDRPERDLSAVTLRTDLSQTVAVFATSNNLADAVVAEVLGREALGNRSRTLASFGIDERTLLMRTRVGLAEYEEERGAKPLKFTIHFVLALGLIGFVAWSLRTGRMKPRLRRGLHLGVLALFGLGFAINPSPPGPVHDTMVLLATPARILHPRLAAILTFLILVGLANKFLCGWACQFGVLQDLLFCLGRGRANEASAVRQWKLPFRVSNSIRTVFFGLCVALCAGKAFDLLGVVNPFRIFAPKEITLASGLVLGAVLAASPLVYRPWCHLFCPFGLLGWLVEQVSVARIVVDRDRCTKCGDCTRACPSSAMDAILSGQRIVPDCHACGSCIPSCPDGLVRLGVGRTWRRRP